MNRRGFFKFLGIGAVAAVVAPKVFAEADKQEAKWVYVQFPQSGTYPLEINCDYWTTADNPSIGFVKIYIWKNPAALV